MKLGDKVRFCAVMEKEAIYEERVTTTNFISKQREMSEGIYIGYRHMPIGTTVYYGEDGPQFRGKGCVKVLLVVCNERMNPVMTDPSYTYLI